MANNTSSPATKAAGIVSSISSLFKLAKAPYLVLIVVIIFIIFFIAPFTLLFSNNSVSSGPISGVGQAEIPPEYIPLYQAAEKTYNVPWNLLAAVHRVETNFGTITPMISSVGALGHMQFMCRTWVGWSVPGNDVGACDASVDYTNISLIKENGGYGIDGNGDGKADPFNPNDAIFSAAKYLAANGAASGKLEQALLAYNNSTEYVQKVLQYAHSYVLAPELSPDGAFMVEIGQSGLAWPVPCTNRVTSPFGVRQHPISGELKMHNGIDIANGQACYRSSVVSALDGVVTFAGTLGGYGYVVYVDHGGGMTTRYAHLDAISVFLGQTVKTGQVVGLLGSTGDSTGPHLHYEIRLNDNPTDPLKFY